MPLSSSSIASGDKSVWVWNDHIVLEFRMWWVYFTVTPFTYFQRRTELFNKKKTKKIRKEFFFWIFVNFSKQINLVMIMRLEVTVPSAWERFFFLKFQLFNYSLRNTCNRHKNVKISISNGKNVLWTPLTAYSNYNEILDTRYQMRRKWWI